MQLVLDMPVQPIALDVVAARLAELAQQPPAGRVADLGGPESLTVREAGALWQQAHGTSKRQWMWRLPGKTFAAYAADHHTTPNRSGGETFAAYAGHEAAAGR